MKNVAVFDFPEEAQRFVELGLWGGEHSFGPDATAIGFANEVDGFVAGVVYHNYDEEKNVIEISSYSSCRNWNTKENLKTIFNYAFFTLNARIVIAKTSEENKRALRIWRALGAKQYAIEDLRAPGVAEILTTYSKDDWLKSRFMR